jgi:cobalamin biosynthesis Co2+ chelatase CbiK
MALYEISIDTILYKVGYYLDTNAETIKATNKKLWQRVPQRRVATRKGFGKFIRRVNNRMKVFYKTSIIGVRAQT